MSHVARSPGSPGRWSRSSMHGQPVARRVGRRSASRAEAAEGDGTWGGRRSATGSARSSPGRRRRRAPAPSAAATRRPWATTSSRNGRAVPSSGAAEQRVEREEPAVVGIARVGAPVALAACGARRRRRRRGGRRGAGPRAAASLRRSPAARSASRRTNDPMPEAVRRPYALVPAEQQRRERLVEDRVLAHPRVALGEGLDVAQEGVAEARVGEAVARASADSSCGARGRRSARAGARACGRTPGPWPTSRTSPRGLDPVPADGVAQPAHAARADELEVATARRRRDRSTRRRRRRDGAGTCSRRPR